jgi:nitrogen-specific signal transduction histidine kinase
MDNTAKHPTQGDNVATFFAPAGRAEAATLTSAREKILRDQFLLPFIEAMPVYVLVLNEKRQILAVNSPLREAFGIRDLEEFIGRRPGEALACSRFAEGPDGCGTGRHCAVCGAVLAIVESQKSNVSSRRECSLALDDNAGTCLDLEVVATPLVLAGMHLTVLAMRDVGAEKRRSVLEKVFFHDVLNTAGGINGLATALAEGEFRGPEQEAQARGWMVELSARLIDEITHQRKLLAAERGEFVPDWGAVAVRALLQEVQTLYANHEIAAGRRLVLGPVPEVTIVSDGAILRRIIGNLVKNALEATAPGETVTLFAAQDGEGVVFVVHNPGVMPEEVQLQLFQRSFSTKSGDGRGIGTYSVKLFGERYLKGKVAFTSTEQAGTTFRFTVPRGF